MRFPATVVPFLVALLAGPGCAGGPDPLPVDAPTTVPESLKTPAAGTLGPPETAADAQAPSAPAPDRASRWTPDRSAPIRVRADSINVDQRRGVTVYQGKVRFEQGGLRIDADRVEARLKGERLETVHAQGRPLRFRQAASGEAQEVRGSAVRLEYHAVTGQLSLFGDVRIEHGRNLFRSAVMRYDLDTETLAADGNDDGQVSATIEPAALGADDAAGRLKQRGKERP
ncbi:MAG TPA: lipopolysaccharide transport periplasmic protein LptA [Acidiferrobacterales bacterium]|jgi:lipopolysaccharide export system protein LptA